MLKPNKKMAKNLVKNLTDNIKAEVKKDAQKIKTALDGVKNGVKGAKDDAKKELDRASKNLACAPLVPMIPAMLYLLKKEKNIKFSAKQVMTERYKVVESFYKNIVVPELTKRGNLESFDMVEMTSSDFEHIDEVVSDAPLVETGDDSSSISDVFASVVASGEKGAKLGASLGSALAVAGVPPPASNLAGASAGAQIGVIVKAVVEFFKLGLKKVKDALDKTKKQADDISAGLQVGSDEIGSITESGSFDFKKLLIPVVALVAIILIFKNK